MEEDTETEKPFAVEKAKTGRAKCKKCKCPIDKDTVRIAKLMSNPFGEGKMKAWHHVNCLFEVFAKQRAATKRIDDPEEDIDGWDRLEDDERKIIIDQLQEFDNNTPFKKKRSSSPAKDEPPRKVKKQSTPPQRDSKKTTEDHEKNSDDSDSKKKVKTENRDNAFREFRRVCANIANASAYTEKTGIIKKMFTGGTSGDDFKGDVVLWCKMLLPMANKKVYNLQSKQLIKLFARIFCQDEQDMLEDLEKGDVAETIHDFFEKNDDLKAHTKSRLSLQEVDEFLSNLSQLTKEDEQISHFKSIIPKCTSNDLKMIIRLIKRDLRINCGPKHVLEAIDPEAYKAYQVSNDLEAVVKRFMDKTSKKNIKGSPVKSKVSLSLMTPVLPMLAEACTSVEMAMKKCPNGMLSEIKYDGERVQVHKQGSEFRYFSRSLKPVLPHKVNHFKEYIPKAFPDGDDLILDCEILMIDTKTGQPLPFGTLGVHKKAEFKDANVCIFIFDCIYYNGDVLMNKTMKERRKILTMRMTAIPNRVMLSEVQQVHDPKDLAEMIAKVLKMGLEGLVLKDINSLYEPGKRHWLKIKKDYLFGGAMADSADLVVLGAWYGTGNKGGMMSVFLMGCYDEDRDMWVTVTKVHTGHDDDTLAKLQDQLDMIKISKDQNLVPSWLLANKPMIPDFVAKDPKKQPVWEITGAEFTNQGVHTADGISIRFPRVTRIREDKDWKTATSLKELKRLFEKSADSIDFSLLLGKPSTSGSRGGDGDGEEEEEEEGTSDNKKIDEDNVAIKEDDSTNNNDDDNDNDDEEKNCRGIKLKASGKDQKQANKSKRQRAVTAEKKENNYKGSDNDTSECSSTGSSSKTRMKDSGRKKKSPEETTEQLSEQRHSLKSSGILKDTYVVLSSDLSTERQQILSRNLITLGATVRKESAFDAERVTHIIHGKNEISEEELRRFKTAAARHVNESWVESTVRTSQKQGEIKHAVNLRGNYCQCKCPHRK
ncbi:DNA ligase 3 isoform X1 [Microplitis demolitor]|uniref:DNA ligase 3 isoform X1 n=1 Tax=Microplitis demolitor TaxID=69319 RepID=UPI0004CCFC4A|nr:DNA ligase 3 isoform X1 [Microplitis demolitor]